MADGEQVETDVTELVENRQCQEENARREEQLLQERQLRKEDSTRRIKQPVEQHEQRENEHKWQLQQMQEQMESMRHWMESMAREDERVRSQTQGELTLIQLTETQDTESYLTTFERMMEVRGIEKDRWAFRLAPQLTGKAQQEYVHGLEC